MRDRSAASIERIRALFGMVQNAQGRLLGVASSRPGSSGSKQSGATLEASRILGEVMSGLSIPPLP